MKHLFTIAFLVCIFSACSVYGMEQKIMHEKYLLSMEEHKNAPMPSVPDEHLFDGMKKYVREEVKLSDDELTVYDLDGNLLTGVVIMNPRIKKTYKNGKADGPALYNDEGHIMFSNFVYESGEYSSVPLLQEFWNNRLISETLNTEEYLYNRRYDLSGNLIWDVINNHDMGIIIRVYDKNGGKKFELDTFIPSATCYLSNGTQRDATPEEIENLFTAQDKVAEDYEEFNFSCQE